MKEIQQSQNMYAAIVLFINIGYTVPCGTKNDVPRNDRKKDKLSFMKKGECSFQGLFLGSLKKET